MTTISPSNGNIRTSLIRFGYLIVFLLLQMASRAGISLPVITSFSPLSGVVGTTITISGANFNATSSNNVVFFGAAMATVTAGSTTSLTVTVPNGATYAPITVLNAPAGVVCYSSAYFTPTFSPAKGSIISGDFAATIYNTTGSSPFSVAAGDLDGDGKVDLAISNGAASTISVLRNTGSSGSISFAAKVDFAIGYASKGITIGDIDGDGKLDVVVANMGDNNISVLRNTSTVGTISFATKVNFATSNNPVSITIADIDGDGLSDLAVANYQGNSISVFLNTGSSGTISFAAKVDFTTGTYPVVIAMGDLDGDGKYDMAVDNYGSNTMSVFRNTSTYGSISFAAKVDYATGSSPQCITLGDIDGDGKPDLAVSNASSNTVSVFRNTGTTGSIGFAAKVDFATGVAPVIVTIGDINGDGKVDLATSNYTSNTVSVLRNMSSSGTISFDTKADISTGSNLRSVAIADLDGDGLQDLVTANEGTNNVSAIRNTPQFPPTISSYTPLSGAVNATVSITGTNYNTTASNNDVFFGATKATATAGSSTSLTVTVPAGATYAPIMVLNRGTTLSAYSSAYFTPVFSPNKSTLTVDDFAAKVDVTAGSGPYGVSIGDIDGDGKSDLAVANYTDGTVSVLRNTGSSGTISFATKIDFTAGTNPYVVAIGDIDGDGLLDLVVANRNSTSVSVLRNTSTSGNISFAASVDFTTGSAPVSVAIGDLDGDGKPDLAVANNNAASVSVLRNTGSNGTISFATKVDYTTGSNPYNVAIGDIDGDGKPEIVVTNYTATSVSVFLNTGSLGNISFAAKSDFTVGTDPSSVAIGDIDGDGKPDIAVTNFLSDNLSVLRNTGSTGSISFATKVDFATRQSPNGIAIGDIDGDGKADLTTANANAASASVLRNIGSSGTINFDTRVDLSSGTNNLPQAVAVGDIDGDGKPDIAIANYTTNNVAVIRNTPQFPTITSTGTLSAVTTTYGTASANTSFSTSGSGLNAGITVTAPTGFEVSTAASSGFAGSIVVGAAGTVTATTVYVRIVSTTVPGNYSGNVVLSSTGATSVNVATVSSTVYAKELTIAGLAGSNKVYDGSSTATPSGTATLSGVITADVSNVTLGGTVTSVFANANIGTAKAITVSGYTISGSAAGNYTLTQPAGLSADITAKELTVTGLSAGNKVYDATTAATLNGTAALNGVITADASNVTLGGTASAVFASATVGTVKAITVSGYTISGSAAGNYSLTQPAGLTADITAKELTVTGLSAGNKVYDATTAATLNGTAALNGVITADASNVTLGGTATAVFANATVGTVKAITVSGYTISGSAAGNYSLTQPTGLTANITAKELTITGITASNKIYDGTTTAILSGTAALSGVVTADASSVTLGGTVIADFASATVGTAKAVTVSGYTISGTAAANYTLTQPAGLTADITAKELTITGLTASNKIYDGTTTATITGTAALSGVITSDASNVTLGGTPVASFASAAIANNIAVTVSGYTISGTAIGNYTLTQPAGLTANILSPSTVTVTGTLNAFASCAGAVSAAQSFTVAGTTLTDNITVTAPTGYELSLSAAGTYSSSLTLQHSGGTVNTTSVYVRLIKTATGTPSGNITSASSNAITRNTAVSGTVNALPVVTAITGVTGVCASSSTTFANATTGGVWSSSSASIATVNTSGTVNGIAAGTATISYTVTNLSGCITAVTKDVTVNALPTVTATATPSGISKGLMAQLQASATGNITSYYWLPATGLSNAAIANPVARVVNTRTYTATATNTWGCSASASVNVTAIEDLYVEPVNIFTPNGDGINDRLVIKNLDQYPTNKLQVFDRSGRIVFEQNNYANDWDGYSGGRLLTKDTYFFVLTIRGQVVKKGTIMLMR